MRVLHVVGSRPNFMKVAPLMRAMAREPRLFHQVLVHTGQHYDDNMSRVFLEELGMPPPDEQLGVGSGSHAKQTARVMVRFESVLLERRPDLVVVVGDVNSTLACALVAGKLCVPVAHVEAGLRSFDRTMPEEVNRVLTDHLADLLFTPSADADENLLREGIPSERIHRVGNVMIDSLVRLLPVAERQHTLDRFGLRDRGYALVTLHRPSNVDDLRTLADILTALEDLSQELPIIFPVHPRTASRIAGRDLGISPALRLVEPLGYLDFLNLEQQAALVITDSGGVQEETTYLRVPCLTVRPNTERPITIHMGTNRLVLPDRWELLAAARGVLGDHKAGHARPPLWDGAAAQRIVDAIQTWKKAPEGGVSTVEYVSEATEISPTLPPWRRVGS